MAKIKPSAIIHSITGKVGDLVFFARAGNLSVRAMPKSYKDAKTQRQIKIRQLFPQLNKEWDKLNLIEEVLWYDYAKRIRKTRPQANAGIIINQSANPQAGKDIYISVNVRLILTGFKPVQKPPLISDRKPPTPITDLRQYSQFNNGEIKFHIRLPHKHTKKCKTQIWIAQKNRKNRNPYIVKIADITEEYTEIKINNVRIHKENKIVDVPLNTMKKCQLKLQMRTVAENGQSSAPTALYLLEVKPNS